jgi:3-methyladenine DNA glycosylase AlkD
LQNTARINNWDLVDVSVAPILGGWLQDKSRAPLRHLARSKSLWERRMAMVATHHYIRQGEYSDALLIAEHLLGDRHDLMHKAVGWMLREVGKRDLPTLESFLQTHYAALPRTALRYAIERFPEAKRRAYLRGEFTNSIQEKE